MMTTWCKTHLKHVEIAPQNHTKMVSKWHPEASLEHLWSPRRFFMIFEGPEHSVLGAISTTKSYILGIRLGICFQISFFCDFNQFMEAFWMVLAVLFRTLFGNAEFEDDIWKTISKPTSSIPESKLKSIKKLCRLQVPSWTRFFTDFGSILAPSGEPKPSQNRSKKRYEKMSENSSPPVPQNMTHNLHAGAGFINKELQSAERCFPSPRQERTESSIYFLWRWYKS
jgi:hypothetical protein